MGRTSKSAGDRISQEDFYNTVNPITCWPIIMTETKVVLFTKWMKLWVAGHCALHCVRCIFLDLKSMHVDILQESLLIDSSRQLQSGSWVTSQSCKVNTYQHEIGSGCMDRKHCLHISSPMHVTCWCIIHQRPTTVTFCAPDCHHIKF